MGSIAMDKKGNMALGYSVVNGVDVFPGIRYTGRLAGDPLGQMTLGEGTIIDGSGVQRTTNSRWGDYTDITVDPTDDCTFWYVNEYYTLAGQQLPAQQVGRRESAPSSCPVVSSRQSANTAAIPHNTPTCVMRSGRHGRSHMYRSGQVNLLVATSVKFNIPEVEAVERLKDLIREHGKWVDAAPQGSALETVS